MSANVWEDEKKKKYLLAVCRALLNTNRMQIHACGYADANRLNGLFHTSKSKRKRWNVAKCCIDSVCMHAYIVFAKTQFIRSFFFLICCQFFLPKLILTSEISFLVLVLIFNRFCFVYFFHSKSWYFFQLLPTSARLRWSLLPKNTKMYCKCFCPFIMSIDFLTDDWIKAAIPLARADLAVDLWIIENVYANSDHLGLYQMQ